MPRSSRKRIWGNPAMVLLLRRQRCRGRNLDKRRVEGVVVEKDEIVVGLASHLQDEREPVPGRNVLGLGEVEREGQATRTGRPACEVVDEGAERAVLW